VWIPALLTGNAVMYKPSEWTLLTGLRVGQLMEQAGIPKEVFSVISGDGRVGSHLLR
jgi:acyl-CoA reductase-like NAD-dependent aldehyde dehydrogenase